MNLFNVYPLFDIEPVKAIGTRILDSKGNQYLDFYGGHAVISIGHSHPEYVKAITDQLNKIAFYSNSVIIGLQKEVAEKLGRLSGYPEYSLFLCNSGAEANENALKLASFTNKRSKVIAFKEAFHGRTSGAVACTDNPSIISPFNASHQVEFIERFNIDAARISIEKGDVSAVIIEGIQGVGGIYVPEPAFLEELHAISKQHGTFLILDEIQSGYGRSGKFFAHQYSAVRPDIITVAKGMGNGFPIGGVLISPIFEAKFGMLGTTFGGNHLACAAAKAVLDIIEEEELIENAAIVGTYLIERSKNLKGIKEIRGIGLMVGLEFDFDITQLRKDLLFDHNIFTGYSGKNTLRLLPPLSINKNDVDILVNALEAILSNQ
ncbi:MAG: aminotransferase class III-fold pyridoxal phosphate-dependent enzyme [Lentimicrobiaceae bacterium]|jgi:acetylornithine aminotransferase